MNPLIGRWKIHDFVNHHNANFYKYCEVGISPDGWIEYVATYSDHFSYFCMKAFGLDAHKARNNEMPWAIIEEKFPDGVNERDYMVEVSGYVGVWYNQAVIPSSITEIQKEALKILQQHKIVDFNNPDSHKLCVARIGWPHGIRKAKLYGDLMIKEDN